MNKIKKLAVMLMIWVFLSAAIYTLVFASDNTEKTPDEQLTNINMQINEIEKNLMVQSHEWNEKNAVKVDLEKRMNELTQSNNELREKKKTLESQKSDLLK